MTDDVCARICARIRRTGMGLSRAAALEGVKPSTAATRKESDEDFALDVLAAESAWIEKGIDAIQDGSAVHPAQITWLISRACRSDYGDHREVKVEHSGEILHSLLTPERLEALQARRAAQIALDYKEDAFL